VEGVVTKTDIARQIAGGQESATTVNLTKVMTKEVVHCCQNDNQVQVLSKMNRRLVHIPVIDSSVRPVGVVNARDALRAVLGEVSNEALLRDYVMDVDTASRAHTAAPELRRKSLQYETDRFRWPNSGSPRLPGAFGRRAPAPSSRG
jgi:CBS domain-containing protein